MDHLVIHQEKEDLKMNLSPKNKSYNQIDGLTKLWNRKLELILMY